MAGLITRRRRVATLALVALATLAVVALATLALGARGDSGANNDTGSPSDADSNDVSSQLGSAPTGSRMPAATASPAGADGADAGYGGGADAGFGDDTADVADAAPGYPTSAKAYAQALIMAWITEDYPRLGQLAVTAAVQQIKDSVASGALPSSGWHHVRCDAAAGSTSCTFRNDNGDEIVIRLANSRIGHPNAATEASLDRTEYSDDAATYVRNFVAAWQHGNRRRMMIYANSTVVKVVTRYPPVATYSTCTDHRGSGYTYQWVRGTGADAGSYYLFRIDNAKLAAKATHSITRAGIPSASPPPSC